MYLQIMKSHLIVLIFTHLITFFYLIALASGSETTLNNSLTADSLVNDFQENTASFFTLNFNHKGQCVGKSGDASHLRLKCRRLLGGGRKNDSSVLMRREVTYHTARDRRGL